MDPSIDPAGLVMGAGLLALLVWIGVVIVGFIVSAFLASLWIRLVITFMRKTLDREYGLARGAGGSMTDWLRVDR